VVDETVLLEYDLTSLGERFPAHFLRNVGHCLSGDVTSYPRRTYSSNPRCTEVKVSIAKADSSNMMGNLTSDPTDWTRQLTLIFKTTEQL
jgi:hypothetical protein